MFSFCQAVRVVSKPTSDGLNTRVRHVVGEVATSDIYVCDGNRHILWSTFVIYLLCKLILSDFAIATQHSWRTKAHTVHPCTQAGYDNQISLTCTTTCFVQPREKLVLSKFGTSPGSPTQAWESSPQHTRERG